MIANRFLPAVGRVLSNAASLLQPIAPLLTRIFLGQAFVQSGLGKWNNLDGVTTFFGNLGIPAPRANATFIATLELVGGVCIVLGLGTRAFALLLSATMCVALMTADRQDLANALVLNPPTNHALLDVTSAAFLLFLLWLAAFGAGSISLDHVITKKSQPST
jgi:putative oxidoreductase